MDYETVHQSLVQAVPELRPCMERLVSDWDNFGGEPPGQYTAFDPYRVWVKVVAVFALRDSTVRDIARRALDFAEEMFASDDLEVNFLAIDTCAEELCEVSNGREVAEALGGPRLRDWIAQYGYAGNSEQPDSDREIIDRWGAREALADCVPHIPLPEIPGITQPANHHRLPTLTDAQSSPDGVVLLSAYNKSGMFVLARASLVRCDPGALTRLARELAPTHYPNDAGVLTRGKPSASFFTIPAGERVWNMRIGTQRHARLTPETDLWVAPTLADRQDEIRMRLFHP